MYIETPSIYTFTEWAEIIEQSHGSHVYWDTQYISIYWVDSGVMVNALDCGIVVSGFEHQFRYNVHFRAKNLRKGMNPLILPAMG